VQIQATLTQAQYAAMPGVRDLAGSNEVTLWLSSNSSHSLSLTFSLALSHSDYLCDHPFDLSMLCFLFWRNSIYLINLG
jgi:hypothetical protein